MCQAEVNAATTGLIEFIAELSLGVLPRQVVHECARGIVNAAGCTVGGSRHPLTDALAGALSEFAGSPTTSLLGRGQRTDMLTAALINGASGAAYSYDDTYSNAMLHPCGPIFVVLLALAERTHVSGRAFLVAFAAGVEVACRLTKSLAVRPAEGTMAWSQTGIVCGPAAALAAGKLLGLDQEQLQWALGIAASESAGTRATHGSMAASLIFGHAAQSGLRAAVLAQKGFTSSPASIERASGFAEVFSRRANLPALLDGLGVQFELLANTYKPYPCGVVIHPAIEAVLTLKKQYGFAGSDVSQITLEVCKGALEFGFRPQPKDDIEAKVSIQHWAAIAALRGKAGIAEGTIASVQDPEVRRLCMSMQVTTNTTFGLSAGQATVVLRSGDRLTSRIDNVIGSVERPMSDEELTEKCVGQAELAIGPKRARDLAATCWTIEELGDASVLASKAA